MASSSNLIDIRMKLSGGKAVVSGLTGTRKETEKLGSATSKTSKATKIATGTTSRLTGAYKELGSHAKLALGIVGAGALFAFEKGIGATEELGKATSGLTRNFDLQTNVASRWAAVAQSREIDSKSLGMTFTTLSKAMTTAAREGGKSLLPFHQLGISQEEAAKGAHNFEWGIMRVAKALGEEEGGAKRAAAAKALLGKGSSTLLPLFSEGTKGLKEQLHWADEYGVTLSGTTTDGIMDMVSAQRENKVAMLGLQVSMTQALMPAIKMGDEQLQEFAKTLNDPHLTAEQKIEKIGRQFEGLGMHLITIIERALPKVAESGAHLGVALAGAVGHAFLHANLLGKVAIAGYVFKLLGGEALVKAGALKVGGLMGTSVGLGLATGAVGAFVAYEVWEHLSARTKIGVIKWAREASESFVNVLIGGINTAIDRINSIFDEANILSAVGVSAPNIGTIGTVDTHAGLLAQEEEAKVGMEEGLIDGPGGKMVPSFKPPGSKHPGAKGGSPRKRPQTQSMGRRDTAFSNDRPIVVQNILDGRIMSETVLKHAKQRAALK